LTLPLYYNIKESQNGRFSPFWPGGLLLRAAPARGPPAGPRFAHEGAQAAIGGGEIDRAKRRDSIRRGPHGQTAGIGRPRVNSPDAVGEMTRRPNPAGSMGATRIGTQAAGSGQCADHHRPLRRRACEERGASPCRQAEGGWREGRADPQAWQPRLRSDPVLRSASRASLGTCWANVGPWWRQPGGQGPGA